MVKLVLHLAIALCADREKIEARIGTKMNRRVTRLDIGGI